VAERDERRRRLGEYLKTKRAALAPDAYDLPVRRRRRVAGLRREEVALLAGISVTWYTLLESGAPIAASPAVLSRVAGVLRLSPVERAYVFALGIEEMDVMTAIMPELEILSGSRIAGESFAQEVALVLRAHRSLKTQVYGSIVQGRPEALQPHLDEARCPIGVWLHDDLDPGHRREPGYTRAARIHAAFHREIERVVHASAGGNVVGVERLLAAPGRYAVASAALERAFTQWAESQARR